MLGELPDSPILLDTVSLPECSDDETIVNTTTSKDGKPVVYSYTKASSSITIHTYLYSGDGSYQEIKQAWLKNIPFDSSCRPIVSLNYRRDGSAELLVREIRRNHNQVTVYATKDGTSRDIISFKTSVQKKSYCPQNV